MIGWNALEDLQDSHKSSRSKPVLEWDVSEAFMALIAFGGMHTELRTKPFGENDLVS
jgi:hypothetical protein